MSFTLTFESFPQPDGPLRYAYVPWDSELYGFPFYELRCEGIRPEVIAQHLPSCLCHLSAGCSCLVYSRIPSTAVASGRILTENGFYVVETLLEIYLNPARLTPIVQKQSLERQLRPARESDLPQIVAIATSAFSNDRLHLDPNLPRDKADQRYANWVEQGVRTGEPVWIYEDVANGQCLGFFHCRQTALKAIDLSLAAVVREYQGSGIGAEMYQAVLTKYKEQGYRLATTRISVSNLGVLNLYARLAGFLIRGAMVTLHWFQAAAP